MFSKCDLKTFRLDENGQSWGFVHVNKNLKIFNFQRPFTRLKNSFKILSVGVTDYSKMDHFIIESLNDYYKRISITNSLEERTMMLDNYNRLYGSWTSLNTAKNKKDFNTMKNFYDEISYQLYLLGYKISN